MIYPIQKLFLVLAIQIKALRPLVESELCRLVSSDGKKTSELAEGAVGIWDLPFLTSQYRSAQFRIERTECTAHFTIQTMLAGLSSLLNKLYGIELKCAFLFALCSKGQCIGTFFGKKSLSVLLQLVPFTVLVLKL